MEPGASLHAGIPAHTTAGPIFLTPCRRSVITPNPAPAAHLVLGHVSHVCSKPAFEDSKLSVSPRGLYHPPSSCLPRPSVLLFLSSPCTIELFPRTSSHPPLLTSPAKMASCPPNPKACELRDALETVLSHGEPHMQPFQLSPLRAPCISPPPPQRPVREQGPSCGVWSQGSLGPYNVQGSPSSVLGSNVPSSLRRGPLAAV